MPSRSKLVNITEPGTENNMYAEVKPEESRGKRLK